MCPSMRVKLMTDMVQATRDCYAQSLPDLLGLVEHFGT